MNSMKQITLVSRVDLHTAYGRLAIQLARGLTALGWQVRIKPIKVDSQFGAIPDDIAAMLHKMPTLPDEWEMIVHPPETPPANQRCVYLTMCESTKLPPKSIPHLNRAKLVIVPSVWCQTVFAANGVLSPIEVAPLGIDPEMFHPRPRPERQAGDFVRYGCSGRLLHGENRKGLARIIRAFKSAFTSGEKVSLHVKCLPNDPKFDGELLHTPNVFVYPEFWTDDQMACWYSSLDWFINVATGGFELHPLEAISSGTPLISHRFGGISEFTSTQNTEFIPHQLCAAKDQWTNMGMWAYERQGSLEKAMRRTFKYDANLDREDIASSVGDFTTFNFCSKIGALLDEAMGPVKVLPPTPAAPVPARPSTKAADDRLREKLDAIIASDKENIGITRALGDRAILCYLPPNVPPQFIANIRDNAPANKILFFSDHIDEVSGYTVVKIPPFDPGRNISTPYADRAFLNAINICAARNITWMLYLETDCRVRNPRGPTAAPNVDVIQYWDSIMFDQHFAWPQFPICSGTPVSWHCGAWGPDFEAKIRDYAARYEKASGLPMAIEGGRVKGDQPDLYPNGALGIYHVPAMQAVFEAELKDPERNAHQVHGFDQALGKRMMRALRERMIDHVGWHTCSYSGCGGRWFTLPQRLEMLNSGKVVSVHQVK